jgi:hypothetical protein
LGRGGGIKINKTQAKLTPSKDATDVPVRVDVVVVTLQLSVDVQQFVDRQFRTRTRFGTGFWTRSYQCAAYNATDDAAQGVVTVLLSCVVVVAAAAASASGKVQHPGPANVFAEKVTHWPQSVTATGRSPAGRTVVPQRVVVRAV